MKKLSLAILVIIVFGCDESQSLKGEACIDIASESFLVNQVINFTNCSNKGNYSLWSFGDGITSFDTNPTHAYTEPGNYTVTLIIQDPEFIDVNGDARINLDDKLEPFDMATKSITISEN